jgi:putative photosynthetic complex assembly protein
MTVHHNHHDINVPRFFLFGAGALLVASLVAASVSRYGDVGRVEVPKGAVIEERTFRFVPLEDGSVRVLEADGTEAGIMAHEQAGFLNGILRGFNYERRMAGVPHDAIYRIVRREGDRLALVAPELGRDIDLRGFGDTNFDAMWRLLTLGRDKT